MTYMPAKFEYTPENWVYHRFELLDKKNREVGCHVKTRVETITVADTKPAGYSGTVAKPEDAGDWYTYCIQATRDGNDFGASAKVSRFRTAAERDRAAAKALARAKKAAVRRHK